MCSMHEAMEVIKAGGAWQVGQRRMADLAGAQAVALAEAAASVAPVRGTHHPARQVYLFACAIGCTLSSSRVRLLACMCIQPF